MVRYPSVRKHGDIFIEACHPNPEVQFGSVMEGGGVDNASGHRNANAGRGVPRRNKRKSVSLRAFKVAIEDLREAQGLALEAAVAQAQERQEEATADLKTMITQLHNQFVDALGNGVIPR